MHRQSTGQAKFWDGVQNEFGHAITPLILLDHFRIDVRANPKVCYDETAILE